jgi:hypothetical protein
VRNNPDLLPRSVRRIAIVLAVQSKGFDDQSFAVPFPDRIAPPGFRDVRVVRASVEKHLAVAVDVALVQDQKDLPCLGDFQVYGSLRGVPMGRHNPAGSSFRQQKDVGRIESLVMFRAMCSVPGLGIARPPTPRGRFVSVHV